MNENEMRLLPHPLARFRSTNSVAPLHDTAYAWAECERVVRCPTAHAFRRCHMYTRVPPLTTAATARAWCTRHGAQLWGYQDFWSKCLATDVVNLKVGAQVRASHRSLVLRHMRALW